MVALFLPGVVLILGAGFVFGFWRGLLAVWAGGAVGQALAFLLARWAAGARAEAEGWAFAAGCGQAEPPDNTRTGRGLRGASSEGAGAEPKEPCRPARRYLFRDWVESTLKTKWKRWDIIDKAIEHDGWKLVLIMRFSPIIPYNLVRGGSRWGAAAAAVCPGWLARRQARGPAAGARPMACCRLLWLLLGAARHLAGCTSLPPTCPVTLTCR